MGSMREKQRKWGLGLTMLALAWAAPAAAQAQLPGLVDLMSSRDYAMGGAYRAVGYGPSSIIGNPAALSLYRRMDAELNGAYDVTTQFGSLSISIADSATSALAGGVNYQLVTFDDPAVKRTAHVTTLGFAYSVFSFLHLGLAARHQLILGTPSTNSVTMNLGVMLHLFDFLKLGFSVHNLIDVASPDVPRYFAFASSLMIAGSLTPSVDVRLDFNDPLRTRVAVGAGVEWLVAQAVPLRAGYSYDGITNNQYMSFGLGFVSEGSGLDLSYRHELGGRTGHLLSLTLKMNLN